MANKTCCGAETNDIKHADDTGDSGQCVTKEKTKEKWITGYIKTAVGEIPQVSTKLDFSDTYGSWKCRWSIGRMDYKVEPGIYCVGTPDEKSSVLVTANYKMTFDRLRQQMSGLNLWILVLDTDGVNVWCAAGKGTFGTDELVNRIVACHLSEIVSHKSVILPQLGASGVAAHEVAKRSGFHIIYGTVRANDIKAFLSAGFVATEEMRTVKFSLVDRIVLTPMELVLYLKPIIIVFGILFILNAIGLGHFGIVDMYALLGTIFIGCVVTPSLLPWLPGRGFSLKGFLTGLIWAIVINIVNGFPDFTVYGWIKAAASILIIPSLSAFLSLNFTGSSTFTSLSGVDKEMKKVLPILLFAVVVGVILLLVNDFIRVLGG